MLVLTIKPGDVVEVKHGVETLKLRFLEDHKGRRRRVGFEGPRRFEVTRKEANDGSKLAQDRSPTA